MLQKLTKNEWCPWKYQAEYNNSVCKNIINKCTTWTCNILLVIEVLLVIVMYYQYLHLILKLATFRYHHFHFPRLYCTEKPIIFNGHSTGYMYVTHLIHRSMRNIHVQCFTLLYVLVFVCIKSAKSETFTLVVWHWEFTFKGNSLSLSLSLPLSLSLSLSVELTLNVYSKVKFCVLKDFQGHLF